MNTIKWDSDMPVDEHRVRIAVEDINAITRYLLDAPNLTDFQRGLARGLQMGLSILDLRVTSIRDGEEQNASGG